MKLIQLILIALAVSSSSASYSQNMDIKGNVYDTTGTLPLKNTMVMAVRIKDSLLLGFTRTDQSGAFEMTTVPIDTFSLVLDHPDFDQKTYYIFGSASNKEITINAVKMPSKSQELEEVTIYAYKDPIHYRGDTLVYVADSFAVAEGAVVEDLLKKLPGISVDKDGKITSQGENIAKVLVDGDEFFGSDPTIATKNLGADGVQTVEVYEKENDEGIGGDDEKIKVLDLKLKDDAKKGYFGRISGASDFALTPTEGVLGANSFYEAELLLNKFDGAQKISVFALGSNTPRSNFGWGDMNKFGLDNENSGGSRWEQGAQNNTSGIPQTLKAGVYYSDKFGERKQTKVGFNYSYYNDRLEATSASVSNYYLDDSTYMTDDSTRNYSMNESHRFNLNFETQLDSMTTFQVKPAISIDKGIRDNSDISDFFDRSGEQTLATDVHDTTSSQGYNVNGFARINRKFKKKKRELEIRYDLNVFDNESDGYLNSYTSYLALPIGDTIRQNKINNNASTSHYGSFTFVEPIAKKINLEFKYLYEYGYSNQDKQTFDRNTTTGVYDSPNTNFSNVFDNIRQQHRAGIKFSWEPKKHAFSFDARVRNIAIENQNQTLDTTISQNFTNFLPVIEYRYRPSMSKRFRISYRAYSQQPSINDLQPVPDNSNPNRIQEGNPDLVPNYVHSFNTMFNTWKALSGRYVWSGANFSYTNNAFSNATSYDQYGRTVSKTVNVDGNFNAVFFSGAGLPILNRKIVIQPGLNASYFRFTNIIIGQENTTNNYAVTPELELKFNLLNDSLEIETSASYSYNNAESSLSNVSTPYSIQRYSAGFNWRLKGGFTIGADGTYTINSQQGDGFYDTEFFILNAEISKKFLKTQNLELALKGNDILNQNINARRVINGNIVTDYRTTIISRYFLLKMTLRFNNRKTKEEDFNGMF